MCGAAGPARRHGRAGLHHADSVRAVKGLWLSCLLLLVGCDVPEVVSKTPTPVSSTPSPLPSGVIDSQRLFEQVSGFRSIVRIDGATAKLTTMSEFMKGSGAMNAGPSPDKPIWVIAILGDLRIDALLEVPNAQCGLFAYDAATGDPRASRAGPTAICDPYFK
jgi:hypothetical protein